MRSGSRLLLWIRASLAPLFLLFVGSLFASSNAVGEGGRISGTIRDASGAVIVGAHVMVTNSATGIARSTATDEHGAYTFVDLVVGRYDVAIESQGFKPYRRTGVVVYVNGDLLIDAKLDVGDQSVEVRVEESTVHVESSDTQLGEVITGEKMTAVPLDGRSVDTIVTTPPVPW
jgi:hypothetical protein